MKNENWIYIGIAVLVILLVVGFAMKDGFLNKNANAVSKDSNKANPEFEKYRSENIPEECRLPGYEENLDWWKQHLSHHQQTWYCLEYYGTSIEEMTQADKK